jgi:hypothetical protein
MSNRLSSSITLRAICFFALFLLALWSEPSLAQDNAACEFSAEDNWRSDNLLPVWSRQSTGRHLPPGVEGSLSKTEAVLTYSFESPTPYKKSRFNGMRKITGRLEMLAAYTNKKCVEYCTGFLVSTETLITAEHCLTQLIAQGAKIEEIVFRLFDDDGAGTIHDVSLEVEDSSSIQSVPLDYVVLRLITPVEDDEIQSIISEIIDTDGAIAIDPGQDLAILGFPGGIDMLMIRRGCRARIVNPLFGKGAEKYKIAHTCDTIAGMSGAPIADDATGKIVAIHTNGGLVETFFSGRTQYASFNSGTLINTIWRSGAYFRGEVSTVSLSQLVEADKAHSEKGPAVYFISFANLSGNSYEPQFYDELIRNMNRTFSELHVVGGKGGSCPVTFQKQGPVERPAEAVLTSIWTKQQFQTALRLYPQTIKLVDELRYCGNMSHYNIAGCATTAGSAILSVRPNPKYLAIVALHELGHIAGLPHLPEPNNILFRTVNNPRFMTSDQCDAFVRLANTTSSNLVVASEQQGD